MARPATSAIDPRGVVRGKQANERMRRSGLPLIAIVHPDSDRRSDSRHPASADATFCRGSRARATSRVAAPPLPARATPAPPHHRHTADRRSRCRRTRRRSDHRRGTRASSTASDPHRAVAPGAATPRPSPSRHAPVPLQRAPAAQRCRPVPQAARAPIHHPRQPTAATLTPSLARRPRATTEPSTQASWRFAPSGRHPPRQSSARPARRTLGCRRPLRTRPQLDARHPARLP